jgi:hypothetical protein
MIEWMTLLSELQRHYILQGMDMGKDIGTQVNPQKVDGDTHSNTDPTSPTIQVLVFGAILE